MRNARREETNGTRRGRSALRPRLAKNLAIRRSALSLTQAELAERIGVSSETIARFERGVYAPSLRKLEQLAEALRVHPSELLNDDRTPVRIDQEGRVLACLVGLPSDDQEILAECLENLSAHLRRKIRR